MMFVHGALSPERVFGKSRKASHDMPARSRRCGLAYYAAARIVPALGQRQRTKVE